MRQVVCKKVWRWTLKLRCTKCGKKETFYISGKNDVPTDGMNGWDLSKGQEICPGCCFNKRDRERYLRGNRGRGSYCGRRTFPRRW